MVCWSPGRAVPLSSCGALEALSMVYGCARVSHLRLCHSATHGLSLWEELECGKEETGWKLFVCSSLPVLEGLDWDIWCCCSIKYFLLLLKPHNYNECEDDKTPAKHCSSFPLSLPFFLLPLLPSLPVLICWELQRTGAAKAIPVESLTNFMSNSEPEIPN